VIFDNAGTVVERYVYDPFGQATVLTPDWAQVTSSLFGWQHLHQGLRFESVTGLYHNRAREYSPTIMRFVSGDPIWGVNLYVGYGNGPGNAVDPSGEWFWVAAGGVIGAVVGGERRVPGLDRRFADYPVVGQDCPGPRQWHLGSPLGASGVERNWGCRHVFVRSRRGWESGRLLASAPKASLKPFDTARRRHVLAARSSS
jgi:RHS repeat-associated protein